MRLQISESKNAASFYVVKSTYENGKHSSKVVEKLGTLKELTEKLNGQDPFEWANEYAAELTRQEKEAKRNVLVKHSPSKQIPKNKQRTFNGGYLFLQKIYHELGLDKICRAISDTYKFEFDLDCILSRLLYGRIIFPSSKLSTYEQSKTFLEPPNFELHHIYRGLEVLAKEQAFIQSELYKNSMKITNRNTDLLYYDCTNYFFEIEQEEGLKQYAKSKENRPNPVVQMGLFMDGDGFPLAFNITEGNTNEQVTLRPLEEKILSDFELSRFVVCTDAGLSSYANRKFNNVGGRSFITTQSLKTLKDHVKKWALDPKDWRCPGGTKYFDISELDEEMYKDTTFYKETWIKENDLEQRLIVSYSLKYRNYQRKIRASQIERALKAIENNPTKVKKTSQNDYKRFIQKTNVTSDGEVAEHQIFTINQDAISSEEIYDGFYGVCTNLENNLLDIIKANHRRWEIEESFRIMKSEFKARPVYLKRDNRIKAHFATCFIALMIHRMLEKKLGEKHTAHEIIDGLRNMSFIKVKGEGYEPIYIRDDFTDHLHEAFGFRTDYEIVNHAQMKNIFQITKK